MRAVRSPRRTSDWNIAGALRRCPCRDKSKAAITVDLRKFSSYSATGTATLSAGKNADACPSLSPAATRRMRLTPLTQAINGRRMRGGLRQAWECANRSNGEQMKTDNKRGSRAKFIATLARLLIALFPLIFVLALGMALAVHAMGLEACTDPHVFPGCFWGNDRISHFLQDFAALLSRWCAEQSLSPFPVWLALLAVSGLWTRIGLRLLDRSSV